MWIGSGPSSPEKFIADNDNGGEFANEWIRDMFENFKI